MLTSVSNRVNTLLLVLLVLMAGAIIAILATRASGGPLDPPGPPGPTMQTLDNIPGSWSRKLVSTNGAVDGCGSSRFECVFSTVFCTDICHFFFDGVLDHETGLVWQRDLSKFGHDQWPVAAAHCDMAIIGGRAGWRLPTAPELMTLLNPDNVNPAVSLPAGHPFLNVPSATNDPFWTSSDGVITTGTKNAVYLVGLNPGTPGGVVIGLDPSNGFRQWCVRGANTQ